MSKRVAPQTKREISDLLRTAPPPTIDELRAQRVSFAYGNGAIENPSITREMVERAAAAIGSRTRRR